MRALNKYRVKGDYYQERVLNPFGKDTWKDTNIRATPYRKEEMVSKPWRIFTLQVLNTNHEEENS